MLPYGTRKATPTLKRRGEHRACERVASQNNGDER